MQKTYRIAHIIDHLGSGGAQEALRQLIRYANRRLFSPEILCLFGDGHYLPVLAPLGIPIHILVPEGFSRGRIPLAWARLFGHLRRDHYDVIHTHLLAANVLATPLAALQGVRLRVAHDQTHDFLRRRSAIHRSLDRVANSLNHHIIAVSHSIKKFLCEAEGLPAAKISVIYNGVDVERFHTPAAPQVRAEARRRLGLPPQAPLVGGVGRLHYQKNFPLFLRVAAGVCQLLPETRFVIAGDGEERLVLESLRKHLRLADRVHFLGYVQDMPTFYRALDVLLLTSWFEGTPLTVLEALAMEVPVVASRVDGVMEVLEDGRDGLLAEPGDCEAFVRLVVLLLQDPELRLALARQGSGKVRREYTAEAMVRQVEELYCRYLGVSEKKAPLQNPGENFRRP